MKQIINCKQILGATFLLLGVGVGQANAEYFQRYTQSNYDQAGLDDVALMKAKGIECSYYGNGNPPINDAWNGFANPSNNKGYGGVAYIHVGYNGIDLCGQKDTYDGCDRVLRTNDIFNQTGRGLGDIFWNNEWVAFFAQGVFYGGKGSANGVYDSASNSVTIDGYKYFPYGKASGRFSSYLREVCRIPVNYNPTFVGKKTESKTLTCPYAQPNGNWIQERTYDLYSDGSQKNKTGWTDKTKTCAAIIVDSGTSTRTVNCPAPQTGFISQSKSYQKWSDGRIEFLTGWSVQSNTCALPKFDVNENERKELCPEGYTGFKSYKWVLKHKNVEYTAIDTDGTEIKYTLSTPYEEEVLNVDSCKLIASIPQIESKPGSVFQTCDEYYGAVKGSYSGYVTKSGIHVSSYSSDTKTTTKIFNVTSIDTTSCKAQTTDMTAEYKTESCGPSETGSKKYFRYKAINSKSEVTYPYGDWEILDNTCTAQGAVDNATPVAPEKVTGLLSNMHFTSSRLMADDSFSTYLNNLAADGWTGKERHKLTISIDDLSNGSYDAKKISSIISKYQSVVGAGNADIKIVLPRSIDKLVGNGNITAKATTTKTLALKSIRLVGTNAVVNYVELTSGKAVKAPTAKETKIQVLSSDVDLTKISSE